MQKNVKSSINRRVNGLLLWNMSILFQATESTTGDFLPSHTDEISNRNSPQLKITQNSKSH